jgi:hypothetical protein
MENIGPATAKTNIVNIMMRKIVSMALVQPLIKHSTDDLQ